MADKKPQNRDLLLLSVVVAGIGYWAKGWEGALIGVGLLAIVWVALSDGKIGPRLKAVFTSLGGLSLIAIVALMFLAMVAGPSRCSGVRWPIGGHR